MIVIQQDVWRASCIAGMVYDEDEEELQLFLVGREDYVCYSWDTEEETLREYKQIVEAWTRELEREGE